MKLYAIDVDHTLQLSDGPVLLSDVSKLHDEKNVVGICGNWALFVHRVPVWLDFINFLGPMEMTKAAFLRQLKTYISANEYIMVGNDHRDLARWPNGVSRDAVAAEEAGFRFISEDAFAGGER